MNSSKLYISYAHERIFCRPPNMITPLVMIRGHLAGGSFFSTADKFFKRGKSSADEGFEPLISTSVDDEGTSPALDTSPSVTEEMSSSVSVLEDGSFLVDFRRVCGRKLNLVPFDSLSSVFSPLWTSVMLTDSLTDSSVTGLNFTATAGTWPTIPDDDWLGNSRFTGTKRRFLLVNETALVAVKLEAFVEASAAAQACFFKIHCVLKPLPHSSQMKGRSLACIRIWAINNGLLSNDFVH